jgi:hypothetical protein
MNENFVHALIFNNPLFFRARGDKNVLTASFLDLDEGMSSKISEITALQCFNVNGLKTRQELRLSTGLDLSLVGYARMGTCLNHYVSRIKEKSDNDGTKKSIFLTVGKLKKPGIKIRELLLKRRKKPFDLSKQTQTTTFATVSGSTIPINAVYGSIISVWSNSAISNRFRTFLFKFYNNILGLNTRVSHFGTNVSRNCTLCSINQQSPTQNTLATVPVPVSDETFKHLFLDCSTTKNLHTDFIDEYFTGLRLENTNDRANFFFQGRLNDAQNYNLFIHVAILAFQFCIWEMKLKKRLLSFQSLKIWYMEIILGFFNMNKEARISSQKYNFPLCRIVNRLPPTARARPARIQGRPRPALHPAQLRPPSPPPPPRQPPAVQEDPALPPPPPPTAQEAAAELPPGPPSPAPPAQPPPPPPTSTAQNYGSVPRP